MRRRINNLVSVIYSFVRLCVLKVFHKGRLKFYPVQRISPNVVLELNSGAFLELGKKVRIHSGSKIKVRNSAKCEIGNDVRMNYGCMVICRQEIHIGEGCEFGPNVLIYDHDHDFRCAGGLKAGKFKEEPVTIGKNVWIGANTIVLRGTKIGDNAVIGAGSIVKGQIPANAVLIQKRIEEVKQH